MNKTKVVLTLGIVVSLILIFSMIRFLKTTRRDQTGSGGFPKIKGDPSAPVVIEVYSDFQCSNCAWGNIMLMELFAAHPRKIYIQFHHFPLDKHKNAKTMAVWAECAAREGKFWPLHDILFERQSIISTSDDMDAEGEKLARELDLKPDFFRNCLQDQDIISSVQSDVDSGKKRGVEATPTYFINGKMVVGFSSFMKEMDNFFKETGDEKN